MLQTQSLSLQHDATICIMHQLLCQETSPAKWHRQFYLFFFFVCFVALCSDFSEQAVYNKTVLFRGAEYPILTWNALLHIKKWAAEKYWEICGRKTGNQEAGVLCKFRIRVFPPQSSSAEQALPGGCRGADLSGRRSRCALGLGGRIRAQTCDLKHSPFAGEKRVQPWAMKLNFTSRSVSRNSGESRIIPQWVFPVKYEMSASLMVQSLQSLSRGCWLTYSELR